MCTMKEACEQVSIPYETLRFYCKEGLVPNVKRGRNNYRDFDERNLKWIESLQCLRQCGMGIEDMKEYMRLCLGGPSTIAARKEMLAAKRAQLMRRMEEIRASMDYIDSKQAFYDGVLAGDIQYVSNLIRVDEQEG